MKRLFLGTAFTLLAGAAHAATVTITVTVTSPPSTTVTCPVAASYVAPVAAGTVICTIGVQPPSWQGAISQNSSLFTLSGMNLVVGSSPLPVGTYPVTITTVP